MRKTFALAAVAALGVLAAACGGVEREPNLAQASERTATTGPFRLALEVVATESGRRFVTTCKGAFDGPRKRARLACTQADGSRPFETIHVGEDEYVRLESDERWTKSSPQDFDQATENFSPVRFLAILRGASRGTERIGEEDVRGVTAVRYRMQVDCEEAELGCPAGELRPVDVWIDDDGLVRRIALTQEEVEFEVDFFDFGAALDIEPPPADQVEDTYDPGPRQCVAGDERPIRVQQAIDVLREHGFEVKRSEFGCSLGIAGSVASDLDAEPYLSCFVLRRPGGEGAAVIVTHTTAPSGGVKPIEREVRNVRCTLFLERENDKAVARLDAAVAELEQIEP